MASRVLVRYAPLLFRASSQAPAVTARLLPIVAAEVHRSPHWATVGERLMCEARTGKREDRFQAVPPRSLIDDLVEKATNPEEILQAWADHPGTANQAGNALEKLIHATIKTNGWDSNPYPKLRKDPRLQDMLTTVAQQVTSVWSKNVVCALRAMWILNLPLSDPALNSVQTEALWRLRRFSYKQLGSLIVSGVGRKGQQDVAIVSGALKQLELRWTEIADARTVSALIIKGEHLSPTLLDRLEDKALEFAEGFSSEIIRKMSVSLALQNRRSIPLLRALSYHLLQKPSSDFTTRLILDMAFAYGKLNFHHSHVFQRMASELLPRITELESVEVVRLAKSFGFLKWLHIPLFEAFVEHYISNNKNYKLLELSNLLMTFARLGFQPSKGDEFYTTVHPSLEKSFSKLDPVLKIDVAWSLCVLQQARPQYLIPLLKGPPISTLTASNPTRREDDRLKLLHIAATLQMEHPGSFNTETSQSALTALAHRDPSPALTSIQFSLREILLSLVGNRTDALRVGVDTVYGWTIDGEMVVDSDNIPVTLLSFKAPHLPNGGGEEPLPEGMRRIAFLAWNFPNFVSKSKELLGRFVMMKRHLQLAGFIIVEVPYFDWLELKTDFQRVSYLKDKIGKAVAEDMAK